MNLCKDYEKRIQVARKELQDVNETSCFIDYAECANILVQFLKEAVCIVK